ncbi:D-amino-acid transaminase [Sporolactobacillus shoreae]|uniref:D-alanine aminotransferase n=1 Tax=Sporolactobacillus shoreae TaxID=1465501 RepID=A0A4Z0GTV9_9BACL|nr:D-amino-acid transaminase [Sporolactobacillus shoreae]TGB00411.1 D-amino-acid transaminase [Sporolactobacillus shoreae]
MSFILFQDQIIPREQGKVDIEDRGYQFGDGIYEAIPVYGGQMFLLDLHMKRLKRSANELRLQLPFNIDLLTEKLNKLIGLNRINDGIVYFQITRGSAPRQHFFPDQAGSILTGSVVSHDWRGNHDSGIETSLAEDIRWLRCDIKTLNLLGNVLAKQYAHEQGSQEAILHRGENVTEGASSNVFIVKNNHLITHPADHLILNGITRLFVLELAERLGITVDEQTFTLDDLFSADEVFITSTGNEVMPVVKIDGRTVADGKAGDVTSKLGEAFTGEVTQFIASAIS